MEKKLIKCIIVLAILLVSCFLNSPAVAQDNQPDIVVCPNCGHENPASSNFCIACGNSLAEAKAKPGSAFTEGKPATLEVGMSRRFHLRDGNIVSGTVTHIEHDSVAVIETVDGALRIPTREILEEMVDLAKLDGARFFGPILSEDDFSISIKTPYGVVVILKRDIQSMDRYYGDEKITWQEEKERFHAVEELTDIFLDPIAFPLQPHVVYISGLSLGYGFTENFMLRTKFGRDLTGDLNLHPYYRFLHRATGNSELSLGVGIELFSRHPMKLEAEKYSHWIKDTTKTGDSRLDEAGATPVDEALRSPDSDDFFWSAYFVMSTRRGLTSGRGKWGWHLGARVNSLTFNDPELKRGYEWDEDFLFPYRIWVAMDYDLMKKLKFLIEVFADNGYKFIEFEDALDTYFGESGEPFTIDAQQGNYRPVDLDFGFLYSYSEAFRVGFHFQSPFLIFYWKW